MKIEIFHFNDSFILIQNMYKKEEIRLFMSLIFF